MSIIYTGGQNPPLVQSANEIFIEGSPANPDSNLYYQAETTSSTGLPAVVTVSNVTVNNMGPYVGGGYGDLGYIEVDRQTLPPSRNSPSTGSRTTAN
jgi:hypothetical protein